jgi:nucleotide-binding universal stress UspA family protein
MKLTDFKALTFDCYGTLIDWETGILAALRPSLTKHGVDIANDQALELYGELEAEAELALSERLAGFQERYPDVTVHRVVVCREPSHELVERAKSAQLVVVGSHGHGSSQACCSVRSTAIVHAVRSPVVVARQVNGGLSRGSVRRGLSCRTNVR